MKEERLKVFSYTKKTFSVKVADKTKLNKSKQVRAFMPNLIHSLDADALALLVYYYFTDTSSNIKNILTIHDCFAVTANNVNNLGDFLKIVYQKIYTEKTYLRELDKTFIEHIKDHYKEHSFDDKTLTIIAQVGKTIRTLKYPSIDAVLGENPSTKGLIVDSSYLIN